MNPPAHHPDLQVLVLAAGKGTRMRSILPKVLHPVLGRPMLEHLLRAVEYLNPQGVSLVVGHGADAVQSHFGSPRGLTWVVQEEQLGTAHAVLQCEASCASASQVLIVCGDTPLLRGETLEQFVATHLASGADVSVLTAHLADAHGYGRLVRSAGGDVTRIVEEKDATDAERQIGEVSSGIFCAKRDLLFSLLHKIQNNNAQNEYYLPEIVPLTLAANGKVNASQICDSDEILGINNRVQLAALEQILQRRIIEDWQLAGVTIEQPQTVRIEAGVNIGADTSIGAGVILTGATHIGDECRISPYSVLHNAWLEDRVVVHPYSHICEASVGANSLIGPFARLRPGATLDEEVHIGNFVEIKQAVVGRGSKINHLSYIGDTEMGAGCNIGAGTITCNYDGANKHKTIIADNVFVGSDTKLVAPVRVGRNATIGAGSIVTKDVQPEGLTLSARPQQRHLPQWQRPSKKEK